ncbi:MAG: hypothetical protein JRJ49_02710 [Deltaproteobacteria bacterium]|nr:hypothetical protein [Deltaproteobacteria bacterium]
MALSITVNNRLFGVLEIAGFSPYQFRYANFLMASDISDILGNFLYQKEMMSVLNRLTETILDPDKKEEEKYKSICKELAYIFFANASALYIPVKNKIGEYELAASENIKYFEENKKGSDRFMLKDKDKAEPLINAKTKKFFDRKNKPEERKKSGLGQRFFV